MSRVQLALNVTDLEASIAFYTSMFGVEPAKLRPGYANFVISEPPLKLVLIENPDAGAGGALNHLGVELADSDDVERHRQRVGERGLTASQELGTTCCYATQDKFWVHGAPDGERWEFYTVTDPNPDKASDGGSPGARGQRASAGCCATAAPAMRGDELAATCCASA